MTASVFIDTNVLVYAYDVEAGDRHLRAIEAIDQLLQTARVPVISSQVLQELYVTLVRKRVAVEDALTTVTRLSKWHVVPSTADLVLGAIARSQRWQISLWDSLILEAAGGAGASKVWSEDLNHGQDYGGVTVINPFR